jgi:hypothetical protein
VTDYAAILERIRSDARYLKNIAWGEPRPGHPEGSIANHIAHLEQNLESLRESNRLSDLELAKLRVAIHVHDTFKPDAADVPIADPRSHASLARAFLAEFTGDSELLTLVQYHDEAYALWRRWHKHGQLNEPRLAALIQNIQDWDLYLAFLIIDGCTDGKSVGPLEWFFGVLQGRVTTHWTAEDLRTCWSARGG